MAEGDTIKALDRIGKFVFNSGLTDFVPGGKLLGRLAKAAGKALGVNDPETVADMIESGLDPSQAGQVREAMAREVEAYQATEQEKERTIQEMERQATERHRISMMGDNVWSKMFRPVVGFVVMGLFLLDHITWRVADLLGKEGSPNTNDHLYQITLAVVGFYFGGRTIQHGVSMIAATLKNKS